MHPYPASFYNRDKVFPLLGFDEFIDIHSFGGIAKTGPYIGDIVLAEKVCAVLQESSAQPIFIFVITMENHGPLHYEKVQAGDAQHLYSSRPPGGCDDLSIYLQHLRNADRMVAMLGNCLAASRSPGWLCWYGDHLPIMSQVYAAMGTPDGRTDYLIWGKDNLPGKGVGLDMKVDNLGELLLTRMGLITATLKDVGDSSEKPG